ncbi:hypothetical protein EVAR_63764_1 [Eumeta japonica]|uniref:Uncharacterized protein n=1 Tax=Eumeta variegata TaxID=151549 RepID=A0A4C1ZTM2_EUMVA|nr:hypothetical protein EVAR_63764_1 [Eumeta japonica]
MFTDGAWRSDFDPECAKKLGPGISPTVNFQNCTGNLDRIRTKCDNISQARQSEIVIDASGQPPAPARPHALRPGPERGRPPTARTAFAL